MSDFLLCLFGLPVTAHEVVDSAASRAKIEELEREKEALTTELDQLRQGLVPCLFSRVESENGNC